MQFAATTVKADLARAGKDFKTLERSTILRDMNIKLKNHVKLVYSKDLSGSLLPPSNIGKQTTITDYAALISAASAFYPCKPTQMSGIKSFERNLPAGQNTWSEPSTSSVSDTLSDSGSDSTNNQASSIPALLEDYLDASSKHRTTRQKRAKIAINPSIDVSSLSNAISMTKILQLSKTARYVLIEFKVKIYLFSVIIVDFFTCIVSPNSC
jgi:hypothetical protein